MYRVLTAAALALLPAAADLLPLTSAQRALLWQEPYATLAEQGAPLPPTEEEVAALPALEFARTQAAIKETLLLRWVLIRAAGHRSNADVEAQSAGLARTAEAPEMLVDLLQRFAETPLSRREAYAWNESLNTLLLAWRVDQLGVRLLAESVDIPPEQVPELAAFLPLSDAFNTLPLQAPTEGEVLADLVELKRCYAELSVAYAAAQDAESAEAAAYAARPTVQRILTTARTLMWLKQTQSQLSPLCLAYLKEANAAYNAVQEQRARLRDFDYGGSLRLRALDALVD
ncbi:MAG: hypothetical protein MJ051_04705 [Akkermansia sp.]|nr:hypothetical protein [Akkermansia sp.]